MKLLPVGPNDYSYGNTIKAWTLKNQNIDEVYIQAEALLEQLKQHVGTKLENSKHKKRITIWYNMVLITNIALKTKKIVITIQYNVHY